MAGFDILRHVYRPLEARSFSDFFSRSMYYYCRLIVVFFLDPLTQELNFIRNRRIRVATSAAIAVTLGGLVYHFFADAKMILEEGLYHAVRHYIRILPYWAALGAVFFAMFALKEYRKRLGRRMDRFFVRPVFYLFFYTILTSWIGAQRFHATAMADYSEFMLRMFGLGP